MSIILMYMEEKPFVIGNYIKLITALYTWVPVWSNTQVKPEVFWSD